MLKRLPSNQMVVGSNLAAGKAFLAIYLMIEAKNREIQTCCNSVSRINFEGKTYSNPILIRLYSFNLFEIHEVISYKKHEKIHHYSCFLFFSYFCIFCLLFLWYFFSLLLKPWNF